MFKFQPHQSVKVKAYSLHYSARILRCIWDGRSHVYQCDYAVDGEIRSREFFEDELEAIQ